MKIVVDVNLQMYFKEYSNQLQCPVITLISLAYHHCIINQRPLETKTVSVLVPRAETRTLCSLCCHLLSQFEYTSSKRATLTLAKRCGTDS